MSNNYLRNLVFFFIAGTFALMLEACAPGKALRTDVVPGGDMPGSYTLILYGGNYSADLETVALLDKEGDGYIFEPYAPDFAFRMRKGLDAEQAIKEASEFISAHAEFRRAQMLSIRGEKGEVIGYELRPLYLPISFGTDDVIDVDYRLKEDRVLVYIKLKPALEKRNRGIERERR